MVNEAGIFILLRGCSIENWVAPSARKWRPAVINS